MLKNKFEIRNPKSEIKKTVRYIRSRSSITPEIAIVLGSGLGSVADAICDEKKTVVPFSDIPHFPKPTVVGHQGNLILGICQKKPVAIMQGRFHLYEGHPPETIIYPIQVLAELGAKLLILTNAAGGLNPENPVGSFVVIIDQINFMLKKGCRRKKNSGQSPEFFGAGAEADSDRGGAGGRSKSDISTQNLYERKLIQLVLTIAKQGKIKIATGIYIGALGPTYETPAEIKMFRKMGGAMIGMSTVLESVAANQLGMKVLGISCITNLAAGISKQKLNHQEVLDISRETSYNLSILLQKLITRIEK
jgi:purine-nucleoside phosphorylase